MLDITSLLGLIPLVCGVVAVLVLYRASISGAQRAWLAVGGTWGVWLLALFFAHGSAGATLQMWWWHVAYAGLAFLPYALGRAAFPVDRVGAWGKASLLFLGVVFVFSFTLGASFFNGTHVVGEVVYFLPDVLHHLLFIVLVLSCVWSVVIFMFRFRDARTSSRERAKFGTMLIWLMLFAVAIPVSIVPVYGIGTYHSFVGYTILIPLMLATTNLFPRPHHVRVIFAVSCALLFGAMSGYFLFLSRSQSEPYVLSVLFGIACFSTLYHLHRISLDEENREKGERLARYLANANARLRDLDKQKTEFVSLASHQLRSPIAAIRGYTSMMLEGTFGKVPKNLNDPLVRVFRSGQHLSSVVDDFLNVTRIEQGRMAYHFQNLDLCALVSDVVNDHVLAAKTKSVELTLESHCDGEALVCGDDTKLRQVFSNIVENAIKYTEEGFVHVTLVTFPEQRSVTITVTDSGVGIPVGEQERLFNKFIRASNANDGTVYGSGLGLYIAREIIRAHNGWIHVASPGVGKGSTFTVEMPFVHDVHDEVSSKA